ncbi:hypothetical protein C1645_740294 [Glomus cerebriforme]|uniref:SWI/SNF-like complex subunit BAF250 C-terminal domain-containing protein n=1 Tax=Glomus cerebriforme TaxID=658196 RepID=A0A397SLW5_9GLOM|nr:hypothetical protein C1645_740294 [Glomus cerebriforme]
MDPSIYQQQPQQQNRAPYPFTGNPQGSSTVMGAAGTYPEQYMTANVANNAAYGTGINPLMPISGRPVYQVPVASMAPITGNGRATAKRGLGSGAQMQTIFSNMGQTSGQNQLYSTGFPNQQIINAGRSTVPTQSFVNTDNQNIDGKSPAPIQQNAYASSIQGINKYYGQLQKSNSMGNNFNSLLNQNQSAHPQQSNQVIHSSIQQEESQVDWLEFGDDEDVVYDFNCSTEFTNNSSGMGSNIQGWNPSSIQSNLNYGSQNASKSYSSINQNNLQQSPQQQHDDQQLQQTISEQQQQQERQSTPQPPSQQQQHSQPPSIQITQPSQQQQQQQREDTSYTYSSISSLPSNSVSQNLSPKSIQNSSLGMLSRSPSLSSDSNRQSLIYGSNQGQVGSQVGQFSKMVPKEHLSTSNSMIVNYSQSSTQSSISPEISSNQNAIVDHYDQSPQSTVESNSLKSNSLMNHLRMTSQEHQGESSSILTSNDNQSSFNTNVQVTSSTLRMTSSTDIPKDTSNIPFNTEMFSNVLHPMNNNNNNNNGNNNKQQQQSPNQIGNIVQSSIVENVTNLRLPVSSGIAGRRNITSRQVSRQSDKAISVSSNSPLISSDQPPIKPTHPKPPKVNYAPKTRRVDSYGGLDLRVFEKFSLPLTIPGIQDLGAVDVHALTMSLKCGMKLEVTNALNTLTTLSYYRSAHIDLKQCGDLVDVLFDMILEYVDHVSPINEKITEENISQRKFNSYRDLYLLSKQECEEFADIALEDSTISGEWLPLHEQCWCVINMIRNFSFPNENNENYEYLATHPRFLIVLMRVLYIGCDDNYMQYENDIGSDVKTNRIKVIRKKAYDVLELRKSVLIILSNIAAYVPLPSIYVARDLLILIADFMDSMDDYYSQVALEVFAKLSVSYDNRQRIGGCDEPTLISFFNCLIQMLPKGENNIIAGGGRLMAQELPYLIMAFYNFACLSGEGMRKKIISTPGFINRMLKMSILLASIHNRDEDCTMLARRAMEMLKVLAKGNEEYFLVYTEQLLSALLTPYIDPVVVKDLESVMYPGDV